MKDTLAIALHLTCCKNIYYLRSGVLLVSVAVCLVCLSVCLFLCLSVCNKITFESLDAESLFLVCGCIIRVKFAYEGHWIKVKVTAAKNTRNSTLSHCKTLIGNDCGSIEYRSATFACSMGLSAMLDWMVWLPSLSRDRKYTHLRVICIRWESNLVFFCFHYTTNQLETSQCQSWSQQKVKNNSNRPMGLKRTI